MTDWMALAAEFLSKGVKQGDLKLPTKLTNPLPDDNTTPARQHDQEFVLSEVLTKPTKPSSEGVVSVSSVKFVRDVFDDRVLCTDCHNYRYGHCHQHIRAGIGNSSQVGSDLASLPQRCPAFEAKR